MFSFFLALLLVVMLLSIPVVKAFRFDLDFA